MFVYPMAFFKEAGGPVFTVATGGTITTDGNYKIHTFTSSGTFEDYYIG